MRQHFDRVDEILNAAIDVVDLERLHVLDEPIEVVEHLGDELDASHSPLEASWLGPAGIRSACSCAHVRLRDLPRERPTRGNQRGPALVC